MYGKCSQELAPTIHLSILTISHNLLLKDFDTNLITYEVNFCINNSKFIIVTTIFQAHRLCNVEFHVIELLQLICLPLCILFVVYDKL